MDDQISPQPPSRFARTGRALLNVSLVVGMILVASLIGVGGAAIFIYKQMGNSTNVAKTAPAKKSAADDFRPKLTAIESGENERHVAVPTVGDSNEWHFAEFSDKPRYIDVTYDGGRQHARLKVNTVLSTSKTSLAARSSAVVSDTDDELVYNASNLPTDDSRLNLSADPGSRFITDKRTGRVIGIDGTAGEQREVRRAQPVNSTIRNPIPEVRVASPVLQYGRPIFDDDQAAEQSASASSYTPVRKAQPVYPVPGQGAYDNDTVTNEAKPIRRAQPNFRQPTADEYDQIFGLSNRTPVFGRN